MEFKISASDFELLAKYIGKHCQGSSINILKNHDSRLYIRVTTQVGDSVDIIIYEEDVSKFPEVIKTVRLGNEI